MGVNLIATVQTRARDEYGELESGFWPTATVNCNRLYHWTDALGITPEETKNNVVTFAWLCKQKHKGIHGVQVKDTDLYVVMKALAKRYGKRNVRMVWETE